MSHSMSQMTYWLKYICGKTVRTLETKVIVTLANLDSA